MTDHREAAAGLLDLIDNTLERAACIPDRDLERTAEMIQSLQVTALSAVAHAVLDVAEAIRETSGATANEVPRDGG